MIWSLSNRADPFARDIADRHYNRQKVGSTGFAPPGRCLVLRAHTETGRAFWITSWPYAQFVRHAWAGAWVCSAFRNEGAGVASDMIREAVAATVAYYGEPPLQGMVTFLDRRKVKPTIRRGRKTWGYTWQLVGFEHVGETVGGLMVLRLPLDCFPPPAAPAGMERHRDWRSPDTLWRETIPLLVA